MAKAEVEGSTCGTIRRKKIRFLVQMYNIETKYRDDGIKTLRDINVNILKGKA